MINKTKKLFMFQLILMFSTILLGIFSFLPVSTTNVNNNVVLMKENKTETKSTNKPPDPQTRYFGSFYNAKKIAAPINGVDKEIIDVSQVYYISLNNLSNWFLITNEEKNKLNEIDKNAFLSCLDITIYSSCGPANSVWNTQRQNSGIFSFYYQPNLLNIVLSVGSKVTIPSDSPYKPNEVIYQYPNSPKDQSDNLKEVVNKLGYGKNHMFFYDDYSKEWIFGWTISSIYMVRTTNTITFGNPNSGGQTISSSDSSWAAANVFFDYTWNNLHKFKIDYFIYNNSISLSSKPSGIYIDTDQESEVFTENHTYSEVNVYLDDSSYYSDKFMTFVNELVKHESSGPYYIEYKNIDPLSSNPTSSVGDPQSSEISQIATVYIPPETYTDSNGGSIKKLEGVGVWVNSSQVGMWLGIGIAGGVVVILFCWWIFRDKQKTINKEDSIFP